MKIWIATIIMFAGLTQLVAGNEVVNPNHPNPNLKYADPSNWQTLPNDAKNDVDVFFVYPTTYFPCSDSITPVYSASWNQTIEQAKVDSGIKAQVASKTSVFYKGGTNLYVPYYQQVSGRDYLNAILWKTNTSNKDAANRGFEIAYKDVALAFEYYMKNYNNGRPFILAGHSQGSMMLLTLLKRKFTDQTLLRKQLVAAYIIGWSVTNDDIKQVNGANLSEIGICSDENKTRCIVTYNTQQNSGDFSKTPPSGNPPQPVGIVQPSSHSVNPLTWVASGPDKNESAAAPATKNLGAVFYKFQPPANPQLGPSLANPKEAGKVVPKWRSYNTWGFVVETMEIKAYTGAQNREGALVVDPTGLHEPGNYQNLNAPYNTIPGWYHNYDYSFFFRNLEQNVIDRINTYKKTSR